MPSYSQIFAHTRKPLKGFQIKLLPASKKLNLIFFCSSMHLSLYRLSACFLTLRYFMSQNTPLEGWSIKKQGQFTTFTQTSVMWSQLTVRWMLLKGVPSSMEHSFLGRFTWKKSDFFFFKKNPGFSKGVCSSIPDCLGLQYHFRVCLFVSTISIFPGPLFLKGRGGWCGTKIAGEIVHWRPPGELDEEVQLVFKGLVFRKM